MIATLLKVTTCSKSNIPFSHKKTISLSLKQKIYLEEKQKVRRKSSFAYQKSRKHSTLPSLKW